MHGLDNDRLYVHGEPERMGMNQNTAWVRNRAIKTNGVSYTIQKGGAESIVSGNSGGKDSTLEGILHKAACPNIVGIIMPRVPKRNYELDADDGVRVARQCDIETRTVDLNPVRGLLSRSCLP